MLILEYLKIYYVLLQGTGSYMQGEISSISWNREFQHVLASTSYNGTTGENIKVFLIYPFFFYDLVDIWFI